MEYKINHHETNSKGDNQEGNELAKDSGPLRKPVPEDIHEAPHHLFWMQSAPFNVEEFTPFLQKVCQYNESKYRN